MKQKTYFRYLDRIMLSVRSRKLLQKLLEENPRLKEILDYAENPEEAIATIRIWVEDSLSRSKIAMSYYKGRQMGRKDYESLHWEEFAAIRILDYIDHADEIHEDKNLGGANVYTHPFRILWLAFKYGSGGAKEDFFIDMIQLFRQFRGEKSLKKPKKDQIFEWMEQHPSGLNKKIAALRADNKKRIICKIIEKIDQGIFNDPKYNFPSEITKKEDKKKLVNEWWNEYLFHLKFAVRSPEMLNEMLDYSLDPDTMDILYKAKRMGIPFFINPYYLSLLLVHTPDFAVGADLAIRDYIIYSKQLIDEFGQIVAWEKEDIVRPGEPNAAGWLLPSSHNVHRRYPEVAILIPDTVGRACGGLCASCQRMYDFQSGNLNFDLEKLEPKKPWKEKLEVLMKYFETDSQLRDILITGGDALMSSDKSLAHIFDAILKMAENKRKDNEHRKDGEKYAEIQRIRLGTRLPVYLPQRISHNLISILADFKEKANKIGIRQFFIQTHFETAMEVTPEAKKAILALISAGWTVTNQLVFTTAASRRGHSAKLRKILNDIGVLTYYTFSTKGYMENNHNFAPNARAVQEQLEEKIIGKIPPEDHQVVRKFPAHAENMVENINVLREKADVPFVATDRNVLNLPGVGKSLTYRTIGITRNGRRILQFDHDHTRNHSPIIEKLGKMIIIESKSIDQYLQQIEEMGEDRSEYETVFGYSMGDTEPRFSIFEYPDYPFKVTEKITNLDISDKVRKPSKKEKEVSK